MKKRILCIVLCAMTLAACGSEEVVTTPEMSYDNIHELYDNITEDESKRYKEPTGSTLSEVLEETDNLWCDSYFEPYARKNQIVSVYDAEKDEYSLGYVIRCNVPKESDLAYFEEELPKTYGEIKDKDIKLSSALDNKYMLTYELNPNVNVACVLSIEDSQSIYKMPNGLPYLDGLTDNITFERTGLVFNYDTVISLDSEDIQEISLDLKMKQIDIIKAIENVNIEDKFLLSAIDGNKVIYEDNVVLQSEYTEDLFSIDVIDDLAVSFKNATKDIIHYKDTPFVFDTPTLHVEKKLDNIYRVVSYKVDLLPYIDKLDSLKNLLQTPYKEFVSENYIESNVTETNMLDWRTKIIFKDSIDEDGSTIDNIEAIEYTVYIKCKESEIAYVPEEDVTYSEYNINARFEIVPMSGYDYKNITYTQLGKFDLFKDESDITIEVGSRLGDVDCTWKPLTLIDGKLLVEFTETVDGVERTGIMLLQNATDTLLSTVEDYHVIQDNLIVVDVDYN